MGLVGGDNQRAGLKVGWAMTSLLIGSKITYHIYLFLGLTHVHRPVPKLTEITGTFSTDTNKLQIRPIKSCSKTATIWTYFWVTVVRDIMKICWLVLVGKHTVLAVSARDQMLSGLETILILRGGYFRSGWRPWRGQCGHVSLATDCSLPVLWIYRAFQVWQSES